MRIHTRHGMCDFIATRLVAFFQKPAMDYRELELLKKYCKNKNVVEYGSGYSTIMIQNIARNLTSFESTREWANKVRPALYMKVNYIIGRNNYYIPKADVYIVDDNKYRCALIQKILQHNKQKNYAILLHDWRRSTYRELMKRMEIIDFAGTLAILKRR